MESNTVLQLEHVFALNNFFLTLIFSFYWFRWCFTCEEQLTRNMIWMWWWWHQPLCGFRKVKKYLTYQVSFILNILLYSLCEYEVKKNVFVLPFCIGITSKEFYSFMIHLLIMQIWVSFGKDNQHRSHGLKKIAF